MFVGWDSCSAHSQGPVRGLCVSLALAATISEITENADMINKVSVVPYSSHHLESSCNLSNT